MADNQKHAWDSLWLNANLATMTGGYGILRNAGIGIKNGQIAWVGSREQLPGNPAEMAREVHDAKGRWITPGLIDCHTHLVYAGNRAEEFEQRLNGKTYADIAQAGGGILSTVRATRAASQEELAAQSAKRLKQLLAEGVTTVEIKSGYGLDTASEAKMLRVARMLGKTYPVSVRTTFLGAHALPPEFTDNPDGYVEYLCNDTLPYIQREKLADAVDGFCESIGFSPAQITRIFDVSTKAGLPVKLHAEQLTDQGGAAIAARYHALSADHLEFVSEDGVKAMAESNTVAVLLPGAFYFLKETRKPPIHLLRQHGVAMALATDSNPGTSPTTSLLLMLNMACTLFQLTPLEALQGVTVHAAKALGLLDQTGTLEPGKAADFAFWDIAHPAELSYHLGYNPCRGIMHNGNYRSQDNHD